jgi:outer membrane protein assembly factor BamB
MKRLAAVMVAGGLAVATASAQYARVWTQPIPPAPEVLDRLNLRLGWRTLIPVEGYRDGIATVQHLGDTVVVQTRRGSLTALDPQTGAAKWQKSVGLAYPVTHKVGASDALILLANGTRVYALDRATGVELWSVDLAATPSSPPTAGPNAFLVCLSNGRLAVYAYPYETPPPPVPGTSPTTAAAGRPAEPVAPLTSGRAAASGSGAVGTLPVPARPSAGGFVPRTAEPARALAGGTGRTATVSTGMDTRTASTAMQVTGGRTAAGDHDVNRIGRGQMAIGGLRPLWEYQTNLRITERPAIGEKTAFVIGTGREAVFINRDGTNPLEFSADANFSAPLGQYGEIVYAACANGSVYALNLFNRVTMWHVTVNGAVTEQPVASDEDLYITSERNGVMRLVRTTGEVVWSNPGAVRFIASNPKFVYALDRTGKLVVLDRSRGTTLTSLDIRDFTVALANEATDRLILGGADGTVISLHDRAYPQPLRLHSPEAPPAPPVDAPPPIEPRPVAPAAPPAARPPAPAPPPPPAPGPIPPTPAPTPPATPPTPPPAAPPPA